MCFSQPRQRGKLIKEPPPAITTGWIAEDYVASLGDADAKVMLAQILKGLAVNRATRIAGIRHANLNLAIISGRNIDSKRTKELKALIVTRMTSILGKKPRSFAILATNATNVSVTCTLATQRR